MGIKGAAWWQTAGQMDTTIRGDIISEPHKQEFTTQDQHLAMQ